LNRYYSTWMKKGGSGCIGWLYSMLSRNESDGLYLENHILTVTHSVGSMTLKARTISYCNTLLFF
jgi:hypothetical protein